MLTVTVYLDPTASPAPDEQAVGKFFSDTFGLTVVQVDQAGHRVQLRGPIEKLESAFGIQLTARRQGDQHFLTYGGPIMLPSEVAGSIAGVLGLDQRPIAEPR
jgi:kumamolisin